MTRLQFLQDKRDWAIRWLNTPADQLPGVLTHEICIKELTDAECELVDFLRFDAYGKASYSDK